MIQRMLLAATLVAALALTASGAPAQGLDARGVGVSNVTIVPNSLESNGGPVTASFRVRPTKGVVVRAVSVFAKLNGNNGHPVAATLQDDGSYRATVIVGGNSRRSAITATLVARIRTNQGTNNRKLGEVRINGKSDDPTNPPPPPPI